MSLALTPFPLELWKPTDSAEESEGMRELRVVAAPLVEKIVSMVEEATRMSPSRYISQKEKGFPYEEKYSRESRIAMELPRPFHSEPLNRVFALKAELQKKRGKEPAELLNLSMSRWLRGSERGFNLERPGDFEIDISLGKKHEQRPAISSLELHHPAITDPNFGSCIRLPHRERKARPEDPDVIIPMRAGTRHWVERVLPQLAGEMDRAWEIMKKVMAQSASRAPGR